MQSIGSVSATISRSSDVVRTPRVMQLEGLFAIAPTQKSMLSWRVDLPLAEKQWNIGLIVGPSGCGKTTIAREVFGERIVSGFEWSPDKSLIDDFPRVMGIKDIVALLNSVGFSDPPAWLRPFRVLSNGEQFRVMMARAMAERGDLFVVDEFTSVVDRTVAQIGSAAVARTVRNRGAKFVAVACHYDILDWLQPDWVYEPATARFQWRELQRRPAIELTIQRVDKAAWDIFRHHHYLDTDLNKAAHCWLATIRDTPVAFIAALSFPHAVSPGWRLHRLVCLPDYQGVGIGVAVADYVSAIYRGTGKPVYRTAGHPAVVAHCAKSKMWEMGRGPSLSRPPGTRSNFARSASDRYTAGFKFVGPPRSEEARLFGLV